MEKGFSVGEVIKYGWDEWKKNWGLWTGLAFFALIVPMIPQTLLLNLSEDAIFPRILIGLIHFVLTTLAHMGIFTVALKAARQESFVFSDFFSPFHLFPSYLLGKVLYLLGMFIGLLLLIVPGIIFALKFNLWPFYVLDRSKGGVEALKSSSLATEGAKWDLFLFWVLAILINALGVLLLGIGILVTWPLTLIAWAKIYVKLTSQVEAAV